MRHALLLVLFVMAAGSPAAAQSCATLGGQLDCRGAPKTGQPANSPQLPRAGEDVVVDGHAETTVSNRGASTVLHNRVIDSHGMMEFGLTGSIDRCQRRGYALLCE